MIHARFQPLLALVFLISGISGLIYQVVWLRMLIRVFGVTIYAVSVVLAVFMAGLALGSFAAGSFSRRRRNPLRDYGVVEAAIGVSALIATWGMLALPGGFAHLTQLAGDNPLLLLLIRFTLSVVVLLPTTFLMGATLPLLSSHIATQANDAGNRVGLLYGLNTIGAVVGVVLAGFVLMLFLGEIRSVGVGAALNILAGVAALWLSRSASDATDRETRPAVEQQAVTRSTPGADASIVRTVLVVYAISGFCALAYQVIWSRMMILLVGSSVYGFSTILAVYLVGIATGSVVMARFASRLRHPLAVFAYLQVAVSLLTIVSLHMFVALGRQTDEFRYAGLTLMNMSDFGWMPVRAALIILPTTLLLGAMFPVITRLCSVSDGETGSDVGKIYGWNTVGAIVGSFLTGFVLIPMLGTLKSLLFVSLISLALGLFLLRASGRIASASLNYRTPILVSLLAFATLTAFSFEDPFLSVLQSRLPDELKIIRHREDKAATVTVIQSDFNRQLMINGTMVSGTGFIGRVMAHMPLLLHPDPKKSLIIGFGAGEAFRGSVDHGVHTTVVDLVQDVVDSFGYFEPEPARYLESPLAQVVVEDGRNFLLRTQDEFDMILVDISPPIFASGMVNLYAIEFMRTAKQRLGEDGILVVWVPMNCFESDFWGIARNFSEVFTNVGVSSMQNFAGVFLLGTSSEDPILEASEAVIRRRIEERQIPGMQPADEWARLLSNGRVLRQSEILDYAARFEMVTDDRPHTEFPLRRFWRNEPIFQDRSFLAGARPTRVGFAGGGSNPSAHD